MEGESKVVVPLILVVESRATLVFGEDLVLRVVECEYSVDTEFVLNWNFVM